MDAANEIAPSGSATAREDSRALPLALRFRHRHRLGSRVGHTLHRTNQTQQGISHFSCSTRNRELHWKQNGRGRSVQRSPWPLTRASRSTRGGTTRGTALASRTAPPPRPRPPPPPSGAAASHRHSEPKTLIKFKSCTTSQTRARTTRTNRKTMHRRSVGRSVGRVYLRGVPGVRLPTGGVVGLHRGGPLHVRLRRRRPSARVGVRRARALVAARRRGGGRRHRWPRRACRESRPVCTTTVLLPSRW